MDEFWICQNCRSLNRVGTSKCYSCRTKYGSLPPEASPSPKSAPAAAPPPGGSVANFAAAPVQASQYTRLAALAPAALPAGQVAAAPKERSRFSNPAAALRRRIAWSLSMRKSVEAAPLGYVTAALLVLILAIGALLLLTVMPAASHLLQHADVRAAWAQLSTGQQGSAEYLAIALLVIGALGWACFSLFIGLTTHNATGLGADQPLLLPYPAGTCWTRVLWTQARIAVGFMVPAALVWQGYVVPGMLVGLVVVVIIHRHVDDLSSWLNRPARHLFDLYVKLGTDGEVSSRLASLWSACFRVANVMAILVSSVPAMALAILGAEVIADRTDFLTWQSSGLGPGQVAVALLVVNLTGWTAVSIALLVPITIGLVRRQSVRKTLVRIGRARSWVARPGQGGYAPGAQADSARYDEFDEDRIVERLPRLRAEPATGEGPLGPGFGRPAPEQSQIGGAGRGGPGFGGPSSSEPGRDDGLIGAADPGGPGNGDPDQASLYSPSTTSSAPPSEEPPAGPD